MDEPTAPRLVDTTTGNELTYRKVHMHAVIGLVPLRHPYVREWFSAQRHPQRAEEVAHIGAQLCRVMTPGSRIGQSTETIQPVSSAIPAHLAPSATSSLQAGTLRINRGSTGHPTRTPWTLCVRVE